MQQRIVIAMALIGAPDVLVLDEPTSALGPVIAARTMLLSEDYLSTATTRWSRSPMIWGWPRRV